jgi:hypothetical protein
MVQNRKKYRQEEEKINKNEEERRVRDISR